MAAQEFAFVPRKLAKSGGRARGAKDPSRSQTRTILNRQEEIQNEHIISKPTSGAELKEEKYLDDSVYIALFELALSEHALWSNAELLGLVDANEDGFISISYLVQTSPAFAGLAAIPPESTLIRCVRSSGVLEGRIIITEPSPEEWFRQTRRSDVETQGGFEVRRKDWTKIRDRIRKYTSFHWDSKTVYVENLPYRARTYYTVYQFVQQLLAGEPGTESHALAIQNISFPPHQKDDPGAPLPTVGKGFAFIILSYTKDVDYLLERWPWKLEERSTHDAEDNISKAVLEAVNLGFRCLSKRKWDKLKEEYLALQSRLLEKTMASNISGPSVYNPVQSNAVPVHVPQKQSKMGVSVDERSGIALASQLPVWFPADCLVFVKNVHPETNKTTLRVLFASAFDKDTSAIDYVDYNKGLDSCYLRLSEPQQARALVSYFSTHKAVQTSALDSVGVPATEGAPIEIELVQGKKEEVYWEKVPEKIRKAAVSKAQEKPGNETPVYEQNGDGLSGRKRKRRKRD